MITSFKSLGQGGGSPSSLPIATTASTGVIKVGENLSIDSAGTLSADVQEIGIATTATTGVVKIGSGITVDSAGTISVEGGQGIEIVTELPASGTDGQTVMLIENIPAKIIKTETNTDTNVTSVTAIGITVATTLWNYEWFNERVYITVNPDNSVSVYDDYFQTTTTFTTGQTGTVELVENYEYTASITFVVGNTGFTATPNSELQVPIENRISDVEQSGEEKEVLYTWSDNPLLTSDIHYTSDANNGQWCVKYKYSEIPNNTTLLVTKYWYLDEYKHYIYENGEIHAYESNVASGITGDTYTNIPQHTEYEGAGPACVFWTDDEVIFYNRDSTLHKKVYQEISAFYRSGWHKEVEHVLDDNVFYIDYTWYDGDYNAIIKHKYYRLYDVGLRLNPSYQSDKPYRVYSVQNQDIGPFFAPTTTGTSGYVCVAGDGWAAPTWVSPETITNGVKFWKGTQAQYDALSGTGYDNSTLYIITDTPNAV